MAPSRRWNQSRIRSRIRGVIAMTIKDAMIKAVNERNATLAGRICDKMRFELGATYNDIEARFVRNTGCTPADFEALMYYADQEGIPNS